MPLYLQDTDNTSLQNTVRNRIRTNTARYHPHQVESAAVLGTADSTPGLTKNKHDDNNLRTLAVV